MSLTFTLMVAGHPYRDGSTSTALKFIQALQQAEHQLHSVFFFHDGVHCANTHMLPPYGQQPYYSHWQGLSESQGTDLIVCATSAVRRGVLSASEARRHHLQGGAENIAEGFTLGGLGQWVEAVAQTDRAIRFGGGR